MFSGVLRAMQRCWAWSLPWWDDTRVCHWVFRGVLDWDEGRVLWVLWTRVHHGDLWAVQGCPAKGVWRSAHRAVLDSETQTMNYNFTQKGVENFLFKVLMAPFVVFVFRSSCIQNWLLGQDIVCRDGCVPLYWISLKCRLWRGPISCVCVQTWL